MQFFALALLVVSLAIAILFAFPISERATSPASRVRAQELFLSTLTTRERRRWFEEGRLTVVGSRGRSYTLAPYAAFNIRSGNDLYCLRVDGRIPAYDKLLAQRLLVECDETAFLAVANKRSLN